MNAQKTNIPHTPQHVAAISKSIGFKVRHRKILEAKDAQIKEARRRLNQLAEGGAKSKLAEQQRAIDESVAAGAPCPSAKTFEQLASETTAQVEAMKVAIHGLTKEVRSEIVDTAEDFHSALTPHVADLESAEKAAAEKFGVPFEPSNTLLLAQAVLTDCPRLIKSYVDQAGDVAQSLRGLL